MENQTTHKWFIRIGILIIGLAGLVFAAGDAFIPQEGTLLAPGEDPRTFAELVTSQGFAIWAMRGLIGAPMETIGCIALFLAFIGTRVEKLALWGMLLCVVADLFGMGIFVLAYFTLPPVGELILAGKESVIDLAVIESYMPLMAGSFLVTAIGIILFALAIWKTKIFPKWSGWLVLLGWLLILVQTSYVIQIAANVVWGAAYFWMAIAGWNKVGTPARANNS